MTTYVTIQNDRLDRICKRKYGTEKNGTVEMVLAANRGLAALGPLYAAGVIIILPEIASGPKINAKVRLWT